MAIKSRRTSTYSMKHGFSYTFWISYIVWLRSVLATIERFFEVLGRKVATNPKKIVVFAVMCVALSGLGLMRMRGETRSAKLFVPQRSQSELALEEGKKFFSNSLNTRTEEIIFIPRNGTNVLCIDCLKEAINVVRMVQNITGYRYLCKKRPQFLELLVNTHRLYKKKETCTLMNPLEMLTGSESKAVIYRKLQRALSTVSRLMSNGRAAIFNIKNGLASFRLNQTERSIFAKALRIEIYLQQGRNESHMSKILDWEKSLVQKIKDVKNKLKYVYVTVSAERSMDDAISESSSKDVSLISVTFAVMITFSCLMLTKFINPVRGHTWLALSGVISTALGILAGIGITVSLGVPFISLVGVVPFLVVSIGIDDMFIIVDEFDRQSESNIPVNRVAFALSKVGATITMTTITDVIAFLVSSTSSFPAIRYFCLYTALCISLEFLLQITLFVAFLTFDSRRIFSNRSDCCPTLHVQDRTCFRLPNQFSWSAKIMRRYGETILTKSGKIFVCVITIGLFAFGLYGSINIKNEFNRKTLAPKGSYYSEYLDAFENNFPQTVPVSIQILGKVNYSDSLVRKQISELAGIAYSTGYYLSQNVTWTHYFDEFVELFGIDANGKNFALAMDTFLYIPVYQQHHVDIIRDSKGEIVASRVIVFLKDNANSTFQKDAMLTLRKYLKIYSTLSCSAAADPFIYFEQYAAVTKEVQNNLCLVTFIIAIMLVPFCIHPLVIFFVLFGFLMLVLELFGLMYFWDIHLNAISMINIVMSVGFTVDYSTHIAHSFVTSTADTVNKRIIDALATVGGSVLMGGISTFLGMSLTGLTQTAIFQIFFKMFLGIIIFGLYNGFVLLPVLMSIFSRYIDFETSNVPHDIELISPLQSIRGFLSKIFNKRGKPAQQFTISVLGMSTRFPMASNKEQFNRLLEQCSSTTTEYPEDRYARKRFFDDCFNPARPVSGKLYVSNGSYLENIDRFDHQFFGISATEAKSMDPQQRMLLEGVYEATEDAGMTIDELQQCTTGVYVGIMNLDYSSVVLRDDTILKIDQFASTGTAFSIAANRISFSLNLSGPSVAIDTACSSSLTALSVACDHLEKRVVDVAIVAAANLILCPRKQTTICRANMLAPDGKCKVFDEKADGYGRGEAIVAFILKSSDLVNAKDEPYAEIIGWGINNDGQSAAPITAPSAESQRELMVNVLQQANVNPKNIQFVEMHGTGTIIGDMVETKSVGEVYGKPRDQNNPIMIGSVKSNVNHTESTAGLAGLAKVCLMMESNKILPTVGIESQAVRLDIVERGLRIPTKIEDWLVEDSVPKLAAVNSFGYGGSNAHLIVREPMTPRTPKASEVKQNLEAEKQPLRLVTLSARSLSGLSDAAKVFSNWMVSLEDNRQNLANVCYTLNERRTDHNVRLAVASESLQGFSELLNMFADDSNKKNAGISYGRTQVSNLSVAFVFGGQGSQWPGMAADLVREPRILKTLKRINKYAKKNGHKRCLLAYLTKDEDGDQADCLVTVQLSIFALQYAVASFLMSSASIEPLAVGGHSLGDITAACVAGILKPKKAVKIIMARASLQEKCDLDGAMAAIGLSATEVKSIFEKLSIEDQICIAAENDKNSVTVSGDKDAINRMDEYIKNENKDVFWRKLATHKAFHSHHMDIIQEEFIQEISKAKIKPKPPKTLFSSTTEGRQIHASEIDSSYWWRNLRNSVQFNECIKTILSHGIRVFIEISPRPVLSHYMDAIAKQGDIEDISIIQALPARKEKQRLSHLYAGCIGKMYTTGYPVSINQLQDQSCGRFLRYPLYPWQDTDLWAEDEYKVPAKTMHLIGLPTYVNKQRMIWENEIDLHRFGFLNDHVMKSSGVILPGACYVELALEASITSNKLEPAIVKNISFDNVLPLHEHVIRKVKCTKVVSDQGESFQFEIIHVTDQGDVPLSSATLISFEKKSIGPTFTLCEAMGRELKYEEDQSSLDIEKVSSSDVDSQNATSDEGLGTEIAVSESSRSSKDEILETTHNVTLESNLSSETTVKAFEKVQEDDVLLRILGFDREVKELDAKAFKELASKSGFQFGECFSLIDHAWSAENKALVRLQIPKTVTNELPLYAMHPCIIDAALQTCIAIGSTDPDRNVIPIGIDAVRVNPIRREFKFLYGYAEVSDIAPDTCDVKLFDDWGNVIMLLQGFRVKEMSKSKRMPSMETSLYEMNWFPTPNESSGEGLCEYDQILIIGFQNSLVLSSIMRIFADIGICKEKIDLYNITGGEVASNFQEEVIDKIKLSETTELKVLVINLLPLFAHVLSAGDELSLTTNWLTFESTLDVLKVLSKKEMQSSKLVAFTCKSFGSGMHSNEGCLLPWAATVLGMARAANLETTIPLIPVDIGPKPTDEEVKTALLSLNLRSAEEGLVVSPSSVYQPMLQRVKEGDVASSFQEGTSFKQGDIFYLSWSHPEQLYCVKKDVLGNEADADGYAVIDVEYVSFPAGSSKQLLENIRSSQSKSLLQCAYGVVRDVHADEKGFHIGDEVIIIYNSKWLRSRILVPTSQVIRKPPELCSKLAAASTGRMALAHNVLSKILANSKEVGKIFIYSNASNRGLCSAIAEVANWRGIDVTFEDDVSSMTDKNDSVLAMIADHHLRGSTDHSETFDCVIFSSDVHPADQTALIDAVKRDGIAMVLGTDMQSSLAHCEITKSLNVLNFKLSEANLTANEFSSSAQSFLASGILNEASKSKDVRVLSAFEICSAVNGDISLEDCELNDCIKMNVGQSEDLICYPPSMDVQGLKEDRSYIVIGGSKGLGFNTVAWMASRGAGTVIAVGRSELTPKSAADLKKLEATYGSQIIFVRADASTRQGIEVLREKLQRLPKLAGIVNSGAVLDDKLFQDVDRENYRKVFAPKMHGTILLDELVAKATQEIDFFVLYSSITSVLGNSGQTAYAAANAFMNSFADYGLKIRGKPYISVCWGAMGGSGMLARNTNVASLLEKSGLHLLDIPTGLKWMDEVLTTMRRRSNVCICDIDWRTFLNSLPVRKANSIIYDELRKEIPAHEEACENILERILKARSNEKRLEIITTYIKEWIAAWISGSAEEVDCNVSLFTYGIDSVGATALKSQIEKDLQIDFQVFYFMQPETTITKLAEDLLKAIHEKFIKIVDEEEEKEGNEESDEKDPLLGDQDKDEDKLVLPKEYLTPIYKPDGAQANLFLVHPSHRYSGCFSAFGIGMKYQKIFALYAFGSQDPAYMGEDIQSVSRIAKACVSLLLDVQPYGPFFLGGYSFGGLVSLEMASLLEEAGHEVSLVVMIDTIKWIPAGRNNTKLLINMFDEAFPAEIHIKEQMNSFLRKIATKFIGIPLEEYEQLTSGVTLLEAEELLSQKANEVGKGIPDIKKILESVTTDQAMAVRCHDGWLPLKNLFKGDVLYIEADDDRFCRKMVGVGSSADCWSSVLGKRITTVTCTGDHYSMMDPSRAPDVGKVVSLAAALKFRRFFPKRHRLLENACHKQSLTQIQQIGIKAVVILQNVRIKHAVFGTVKLSKSQKRLKFIPDSKLESNLTLKLKDVKNITQLDIHGLDNNGNIRGIEKFNVFAGLCLITNNFSKFRFMFTNGQDYRRFTYTLEAFYSIKLPF